MTQRREEFEEEHGVEGGALSGLEGKKGITKGNVQQRAMELKEAIQKAYREGTPQHDQAESIKKKTFGARDWNKNTKDEDGLFEELDILYDYLQMVEMESIRKKEHKQKLDNLHKSVIAKYDQLTEWEIKTLVVENKWFSNLRDAIEDEVQKLTQQLAGRVKELEARYARPLPKLEQDVEKFSKKVERHLKKLGRAWG